MKERRITDTTFILVRADGTSLMQVRDEKAPRYPGQICFPGTHIAPDETPFQSIVAGAKRKFGVTITEDDCCILTVYRHDVTSVGADIDLVVLARIPAGVEPQCFEGRGVVYKTLKEIKEMVILPFEQESFLDLLED